MQQPPPTPHGYVMQFGDILPSYTALFSVNNFQQGPYGVPQVGLRHGSL